MAVLGLRFCVRAFSSCGKWGPLFIVVRGPLTTAASLVAEHRLQTRRLSNCGSRAQPLRGTRGLPRPGLEPVSSALAGRPSTTAPPGKPQFAYFWYIKLLCLYGDILALLFLKGNVNTHALITVPSFISAILLISYLSMDKMKMNSEINMKPQLKGTVIICKHPTVRYAYRFLPLMWLDD